MDGYAVATEMRKRPETAEAILAAVSGYGQDEDRRRSHAAGFNVHLLKPVPFDAVREVMARA
jgi:two-component system CheB/CheR fusion protein